MPLGSSLLNMPSKSSSLLIRSSSTLSSAHWWSVSSSASHSAWNQGQTSHEQPSKALPHYFILLKLQYIPWKLYLYLQAWPWRHHSSAPAWSSTDLHLWGLKKIMVWMQSCFTIDRALQNSPKSSNFTIWHNNTLKIILKWAKITVILA